MTNHNKRKKNMNQRELEAGAKRGKTRRDQVTIGFASDWLSRWREFF